MSLSLNSELARQRQQEYLDRATTERLIRDVTVPNRIRRTASTGAVRRVRTALRLSASERQLGAEQCC